MAVLTKWRCCRVAYAQVVSARRQQGMSDNVRGSESVPQTHVSMQVLLFSTAAVQAINSRLLSHLSLTQRFTPDIVSFFLSCKW